MKTIKFKPSEALQAHWHHSRYMIAENETKYDADVSSSRLNEFLNHCNQIGLKDSSHASAFAWWAWCNYDDLLVLKDNGDDQIMIPFEHIVKRKSA